MPTLRAECPRCTEALTGAAGGWACPVHGPTDPVHRPELPSYDAFAVALSAARGFPTYLPWPMSPGWCVSDFGVVEGAGGARATMTCCSGTSALDGPVEVYVVAEESGTGLGSRCAGTPYDDPGSDIGAGPPTVRVRIGSQSVPLWSVPMWRSGGSSESPEVDRSVVVGEAEGRWLWVVLRPASAVLLLRDEWILRDVSGIGPPLVELPFGGPSPAW